MEQTLVNMSAEEIQRCLSPQVKAALASQGNTIVICQFLAEKIRNPKQFNGISGYTAKVNMSGVQITQIELFGKNLV